RSCGWGAVEPEFYLRGVLLEPCRVFGVRRDVIPVTCTVTAFFAVQREDQLAVNDDAHIVGLMMMQGDRRAGPVRSEQDVASRRLQLERVERPVELRKASDLIRETHRP